MNINISLIGQMLTFMVLVWFTMRFVWPPVMAAMEERRKKIAEGLAAAEQGEHQLALATEKAKSILLESKKQAAVLIDQAEKRCQQMIDEGKNQAKVEAERLISSARTEIDRQYLEAEQQLKNNLADQAMAVTEKVLTQSLDEKVRAKLFESILKEVEQI